MKRKQGQTGQVFQRHGSWYVRFYENRVIEGTVKRVRVAKRLGEVTTRGKLPPAAIQDDAEKEVLAASRPNIIPENVVKLGDFVEQVYFPRVEHLIRPSTLKGYKDIWSAHLKPRCGSAWVKDVRTYHVQQWLDDVAFPGVLSRRTLQHIKCCLSAIFKLAKQQGYFVGENPVRDTAVSPTAKEPQETYAYSLDEIRDILAVIPQPAGTIFAVAAFAGLRRGEIRGLRWEDYSNGEIRVRQSVWEGHTTKPKTRQSMGVVPVIRPLAKMLDAHRLRCGNPESGPVFVAANGSSLSMNNVLNRAIKPALDRCRHCRVNRTAHGKADPKPDHEFERDESRPRWHGWHAARRGLGSNLYALGIAEKIIQAILRHANVSTTNTYYIKTAPADAMAAMAKLENAIPQLGNSWATDSTSSPTTAAVN